VNTSVDAAASPVSDGRLRFGFTLALTPDAASGGGRYSPAFALCRRAEELGFDFVTVAHHRFSPEHDAPSAPLVVLAAVAARTSRLRLSSSIFLAPLYHALDVAEQIATLDQLSDGRANLTFGVGYRPYEYEHAGLRFTSRGSRLEEGLEVMRQAWTADEVHFHGQHYDIDGARVVPRPVQQPHPPIWLGAQAKRGLDRTARLADGWMADYMQPLSVLRRRVAYYRQRCEELGRSATVCLMRQIAIGPTRRHIEESWPPTARRSFLYYWEAGGRWPGGEDLAARLAGGDDVGLDEFISDRDVAGAPEDCIAQLDSFREITGYSHILATFGAAGNYTEQRAALELFGREVIPAFT
jgi:probable F420-dependent oxidoreductase